METNQQTQAIQLELYTVAQFCTAFGISRTVLYALWKEGRGPKVFYCLSSPRISRATALEWVRANEQPAEPRQRKKTARKYAPIVTV